MPTEQYERLLATGSKALPPATDNSNDGGEFLDASTQAALLFNSFVGGAAVAEYSMSHLEILRTNDQFLKILGCSRQEYARLDSDVLTHFDPSHAQLLRQALEEAMHTGQESYCELCSLCLKSGDHLLWTGNRIRFLARNANTFLFYISVENITQRVVLEKQLAETTKQAQALIANAPGGIISLTVRGHELVCDYVSRGVSRMLGFPYEELQHLFALSASAQVYPEDLLRISAAAKAAVANMTTFDEEYRMICKDGRLIWVRLTGTPMLPEDGAIRLYCTYNDITARKTAEAKFAYRNSCMTLVDKALSAGTIIRGLTLGTIPLFVSGSVEPLLGYTVEEFSQLYKTSYRQIIHPDDFERVVELNHQYIALRPAHYEMEYRLVRKDGSVFWIMERATYLSDFEGQSAYLSVYVDISHQKRAQEELRMEEEAYRVAVMHTSSLVYRYDIAAGVIRMPENIAQKQHMPAEIGGMPDAAAHDPCVYEEDLARYVAFYADIAAGIDTGAIELRHLVRDGSYHWFRGDSSIIRGDSGRALSAVVTFTDIQQEKQTEEEISSLREKERIIRIMARHSQRYIVLYDYASDTFAPYDSSVNVLGNVLPLYPSPADYIRNGIIAPESISDMQSCYRALRSGQPDNALKFKARGMDGTWRWFDAILSAISDDEGKPQYAIVSFADITDGYNRELAYQRYRNLLASSGSERSCLLDYNLTRNALDDYTPNVPSLPFFAEAQNGFFEYIDALGHHFVCEDDRRDFLVFFNRARLMRAFRSGDANGKLEFMAQWPGTEQPVYMLGAYQMVAEPYSSDIRLMFSLETIDKRKRAQLALLERAQNDAVTHVLNRATFTDRVEKLLSGEAGCCAFAMLDIDHFKRVNDRLGHVEGDSLLRDVAQSILSFTRKDDVVGRLGGDEFGILFTGIAGPGPLAHRLRELLEEISQPLDGHAAISASIGVALYPQDAGDFTTLYKMADNALYQGKAMGRNRFVFYASGMDGHLPGGTPPPLNDSRHE